jgi:hypothetical protein
MYLACYVTCYAESYIICLVAGYDPYLCQVQGPLTYTGRKRSTTEHHHRGKQVLDIHQLRAERLAALSVGVICQPE